MEECLRKSFFYVTVKFRIKEEVTLSKLIQRARHG